MAIWAIVSLLIRPGAVTERNPNILFLFADDMRYNSIHALGNAEIITPNLDRLSKEGLYFNNFYIMGGTSAAVCAPSRAMMMTGRSLFNIEKNGEWDYPIGSHFKTLPETLLEAGYETFGTGKQHNGKEVYARGFSSGGHLMFGGMSAHYEIPVHNFNATGEYPDSTRYLLKGRHSSEIYADDALHFLEEYQYKSPFFMYVSFQAPHDPRQMPDSIRELYHSKPVSLPGNFLPEHPFDNGELRIRDELLAGFPREKEEVKKHLADYYAMITHLDQQIGRILELLRKKGLYENTLIIFSSDNGLAVGQHGLMGKQNLYEHSIKIPLLLCGPGIPRNQVTNAFCYLTDLYPTLMSWLGIKTPATVEGRSFIEVIKDPDRRHRETIVTAYKDWQRSIRMSHLKLIEYRVNSVGHTQLFDLDNDPLETMNLADSAFYNRDLQELRIKLYTTSKALNDTSQFWAENPVENHRK